MNVSMTEVLALLGSKTLEVAMLEGQVAQLQAQLKEQQESAKQAKQAKVPVELLKVVE